MTGMGLQSSDPARVIMEALLKFQRALERVEGSGEDIQRARLSTEQDDIQILSYW
jgi:hypothetical protein